MDMQVVLYPLVYSRLHFLPGDWIWSSRLCSDRLWSEHPFEEETDPEGRHYFGRITWCV